MTEELYQHLSTIKDKITNTLPKQILLKSKQMLLKNNFKQLKIFIQEDKEKKSN